MTEKKSVEKIERIEDEIRTLKSRNQRVELDKAWETSWLRRLMIAIFTYLPLGLYMWVIKIKDPWLNAIIPTLGFLISTLAFPWLKQTWISKRFKENSLRK